MKRRMALSRYHIITVILPVLLLVPDGRGLLAQTVLTPGEQSRIWIEGRSNINQFECNAEKYDGRALFRDSSASTNRTPEMIYRHSSADRGSASADPTGSGEGGDIDLRVEISVEGFECGRQRMNRDLKNALKSDRHPLITFELQDAGNLPNDPAAPNMYQLQISGVLTVAGTSRDIQFSATGEILDTGELRARGKKSIRMTDYNVDPPSGLFGLVKAEDELTVHFDLYSTIVENRQ